MSAQTVQPKPSTVMPRWAVPLGGVIIVFFTLAAYSNSFNGPFVFDDLSAIIQNQTIRHPRQIWNVLFPPANLAVGGRPVLNFSFALNHAISGLNVWSYHALNLAIHLLAGLTLFGLVRQTLLRAGGRFQTVALPLGLMVALLWILHPVQTASVTYISQRAESLMGLFYLLTLYCFIRGAESRARLWFSLSIAACLLGMATKEVMVTAPVMVLLYDRTFIAGSWREAWQQRWRFYAALACTWFLPVFLMLHLTTRGVGYGLGLTWWKYALIECQAVVHYLRLAVWPHPLVLDYGPHSGNVPVSCVVVLIMVVAIVLAGFLRWPRLGFAGLWFFVILAPTSSVVPVAYEPVAENRIYLSLAGVVILAVLGLYSVLGRRGLIVSAGLAIGCGMLTVRRNEDYRSEVGLWRDTVEKQPGNPRAHYNLGYVLFHLGRTEEAVGEYQKALQLKPDYADAHNNLGNALSELNRVPEAIIQYHAALQLEPDEVEPHDNLGNALAQMGLTKDAISEYRTALRLDPGSVNAHYDLGNTFFQTGRVTDAIAEYQSALRLEPNDLKVHNNLGNALVQIGRMKEAVDQFQEMLRLDAENEDAHYNLGIALAGMAGRKAEAIRQFEEVLRLDPDNADARSSLAELKKSRP